MSQGKETTILLLSLFVTAGIAGGGYWFFSQQKATVAPTATPDISPLNPTTTLANLSLDASAPNPSVLGIDGSTSMVTLIKELRNAFGQINPNIPTTFGFPDGKPNGSSQGIQNLINGTVTIAATSRPLKSSEAQGGVQLVPIAQDAIAIVVGINNPFKGYVIYFESPNRTFCIPGINSKNIRYSLIGKICTAQCNCRALLQS